MSRDDAGRHRSAEAEGVTDREHPVTDAGVPTGEIDVGELLWGLDLEQRHIGAWIGADQRCRVFVAALHRHRNLGVLDHMVVGDEVAVGRNEEAGALRHRRARARRTAAMTVRLALTELLEEIVERVVLRDVGHAGDTRTGHVVLGDLQVALHVDADNRRAHLLHEVGEGQRRCAVRRLHGLRCLCRRCGLRRLGRSEAHVLPKRDSQGPGRNQGSSRYRHRPAGKFPRGLVGHGALVRIVHKSPLSCDLKSARASYSVMHEASARKI